MKKYFKLLCFMFITFFVIGFGGERVIAEEAPSSISVKKGAKWYQDATWNSTVKITTDDKYYAFCLDSNKNIYVGSLTLPLDNNLYSNKRSKVASIYAKAVEYGLGNGSSSHKITIDGVTYTVSETDLYGITQIAIWNAIHPTGEAGATSKYITWLNNKGYSNVYASISSGATTKAYALQLIPEGRITTTETEIDGTTYLVSNSFTLNKDNIPDGVTYTVAVVNGEVSVNNGSWVSSSASIKIGDKVKVRMVKPTEGIGDLYSAITVTSSSFITGYKSYFYNASSIGNYQNMGILIPTTSTRSVRQLIKGTYENDTEIEIQKADKITGKKVAGALIGVYNKSDDTLITTVTTTAEGEENPKVSLYIGEYYVKEIKAPVGYALDETHVDFEVYEDNGSLKIRNSAGTEITTVTAIDQKVKVKYRKVDADGNPISGVRIEIYNYGDYIAKLNENGLFICAITDSNGYLTKPCDNISNPDKYYSSTGEYDFESTSTRIYFIKEGFKTGYYNPIFDDTLIDFAISPTEFITSFASSKYLTIDGDLGEDSVVTLNIINEKSISISKTDTGTGAEIAGAEMHIYDAEAKDCFVTSELDESCENAPFVEVDSWVSTTTPHTFVGIETDHKYILTETVAPTGYVRITTDIEFSMDEDGKVTVYSTNSTVSDDAYKLIVGNDQTIEVPNTGISALNLLAIGGLMVFIGYETIKMYRKKVNE